MKRLICRIISVLVVVLLIASIVPFSAFAYGASAEYYTDSDTGLNTGIKKISLDGFNYYDCSSNTKPENVNTTYYYNMLKQKVQYSDTEAFSVLERWAHLAAAIFESEEKYTCSHDFSDYYGKNHDDDKNEQCFVGSVLANPDADNHIDEKNDGYYSTGLSSATSFSQIREKMGDEVARGIGRKNCDGSDILSQGNHAGDALPQLKDDTNREILYNLVTSVTREGKTYKYQYNSYGVAFYDFSLKMIADEDLEYVSDAQKYADSDIPVKAAADAGEEGFEYVTNTDTNYLSSTINESVADTQGDMNLVISNSQTVSSSFTTTESFSYSEAIGGNVSFEAGLGEVVKGTLGFNLSFTFNQAYSDEAMNGEETTYSIDNSYTASCVVPAQTVAYIKQDSGMSKMTLSYDTPMAITFKVAVFSISGDVYADGAATLAFSTAGYDQENFSTFFGENLEAGSYAYTALNSRYANRSISGWDGSHGNNYCYYIKHGGSSEEYTTKDLDWNSINNIFKNNIGSDTVSVDHMATCVPMLSCGAKTTVKANSINSEIYDPKPLYLPTRLSMINNEKTNFIIYDGGRFYMNTVSIGCFNRNDVPYFPFKITDGAWHVCEGSEDIIEYDPSTYSVIAKNIGTGFLEWRLNDDVEYTAEREGGVVTSEDLAPVKVAFSVRNNPFVDTAKIEVVGDEFKGTVGDEPIAVDELLKVVFDDDDSNYAYVWELDESCSEEDVVLADGKISFKNDGTYKIRAKVNFSTENEYVTEWFEMTPRQERVIVSAKLNKEKFDKFTLLFRHFRTHKHLSQATINVCSYVDFYDQYGDKWIDESSVPEIVVSIDNTDGAYINENNDVVIHKGGEYNVTVISYGLVDPYIGTLNFTVEEDVRYHHGDVDGDEALTIYDATLIQRHIAYITEIAPENIDNADVNRDEKISIIDATIIQQFVAKIIDEI